MEVLKSLKINYMIISVLSSFLAFFFFSLMKKRNKKNQELYGNSKILTINKSKNSHFEKTRCAQTVFKMTIFACGTIYLCPKSEFP